MGAGAEERGGGGGEEDVRGGEWLNGLRSMMLLSESESEERAGEGRGKMGLSLSRELMGTSTKVEERWSRGRWREGGSWG